MKTKAYFLTIAIAAIISLAYGKALAHSSHDHSLVPYSWELSEPIKTKLERNLFSDKPSLLLGLSHFEQNIFNHHKIRVGNRFNTVVKGINFLMERTSAGMRVVDATRIAKMSFNDLVPIKRINMLSKVSLNQPSHKGHNHAYVPYEWTFGTQTQDKIVRVMIRQKKNIYVGLTKLEQSLLKEYGIQNGNTFQTIISGHRFYVEKTSAGIKVINYSDRENVAMVTGSHVHMDNHGQM